MRKLFLAIAALSVSAASAAQAPAKPPRLLIAISVDGLSSELFDRYRPHFTGGLARLSRGTLFRNAAPANVSTVGPIGDLLQERRPQSLAVAVAGDRSTAMAIGGTAPDQRWYWEGMRFATDTAAPAPRTAALANSAVASMIAAAQQPLVPPPACASAGGGADTGERFARRGGDVAAFAASPAMDGAMLALAAGLAQELQLGKDAVPDLLSVGLPATERVAQRFGPNGEAMCLQLLSLDRDLGDFFRLLDRGGIDYAVVLTAAPGSVPAPSSVPILLWRQGMTAAERTEPVSTADVAPTIAAMLALAPPAEGEGECIAGIEGIACPLN